ncbi:DUF3558 domain-containing protein [Nocardia australiensis]|uniref:DUF3558 domain-containing protein n=1 Tax=Nocardia australiensis TaxID=2887191 RepID=UPI001D150657|nr:DUF3558 domain-containing protein [Nocardia australiensis]
MCVLTGCSTTDSGDSAPSTSAAAPTAAASTSGTGSSSIKVSVPPAPDQVVPATIGFDPCFRVTDSLIEQVGFDPESRERNATEVAMLTLTKIGCTFHRSATINGELAYTGFLTLTSSTEKLAEIGGNQVFDTTPIAGRPAVLYRSSMAILTCDAAVESADGTLLVSLTTPPAAIQPPEPCDQIREVAPVIASALDTN